MKRNDNNICIIGLGYVGLTLTASMSEKGFYVCGVESNLEKLHSIERGTAHFHEPGLNTTLCRGISQRRLVFSNELPKNKRFDVYIITVGTPIGGNKQPNMALVKRASDDIGRHMEDGSLIVLRSTVKLGTSEKVVKPILDRYSKQYHLAFCPERTVEGNALREFSQLPQIVGGLDEEATSRALNLFRRLTPTVVKVSNLMAAELAKLLDNSYRDVFFSLGNEVALMCEVLGLNSHEIIRATNIGYARTNIARPGFVGGPCLEKDPHILVASLKKYKFKPKLIIEGRRLNESIVDHIFSRIIKKILNVNNLRIGILGLAFKGTPPTDDMRGSPVIDMINKFRTRYPEIQIVGHDYFVNENAVKQTLNIEAVSEEGAFENSNLVIIMTNNEMYSWLDIENLAKSMVRPALICDCWGMLPLSMILPEGVSYYAFGK